MSLTCSCDGDYDWYYDKPDDYSLLETNRRRRCVSCNDLIELGATVTLHTCWRPPNCDYEENRFGDEVQLANKYHCEKCADIEFNLTELGFCINLGDNMNDLLHDYHEVYGPKK